MRVIKPRNNNTYRIQSRNKHLMNVLELDYYIELGVVKMETINRFIKKEVINLNELIDTNLLVSGIGSITGDYEVDLNYQLNYLLNFRLKNSTYKLLLTAGIIKYYDEKNCEKYAPLVLIPFDLDPSSKKVIASAQPILNMEVVSYIANKLYSSEDDVKRYTNDFQIRRINNAFDIDKLCLDIAKSANTTVNPTNYLTFSYVEYPGFYLNNDFMTPERSIFEMTEKTIVQRFFKNIYSILPTNFDQKYVLIKANEGDNFAVDGRLGSGKTYTIINLIADQVRKGKKILYLNQDLDNISSLENKLIELGIGKVCYQLSKTNKKIDNSVPIVLKNETNELNDSSTNDLFRYIGQSQKTIHGFSIQKIFEELAVLKRENPKISTIKLETVLERHEVKLIYDELVSIEDSLKVIDLYANNIWHRLHTSYNNITKVDIINRVEELSEINLDLHERVKKFCNKYQIVMPNTVNELQKLISHIYNFVSIRPLPEWKDEKVRKQIINNLNELQKLVDVNYRLTKYYLLIIKNGYEPGTMLDIFNEITSESFDLKWDGNKVISNKVQNHNNELKCFNNLISSVDELTNINKEIKKNIRAINDYFIELQNTFKLRDLNNEIFDFLTRLSNHLNNNKLNRVFVNAYRELPSIFTKNGDTIITAYKKYKEMQEVIPKYMGSSDKLSIYVIETCYQRKNVDKALASLVNRNAVRKEHRNIKEVVNNIKEYYQAYKEIQTAMGNIFGQDDYEMNYVEQFTVFYQFIYDLNPRQLVILKDFFETFKNNNYQEKYLQKITKLLNDYKKEGYQTESICNQIKNYNIEINEENIVARIIKLEKWSKYLEKVEKLLKEIYQIFKQKAIVTLDNIVELIKNDNQYHKLRIDLKNNEPVLRKLLGRYYNGLDTVINEISQTVEHYDEFLKNITPNCQIDELLKEKRFDTMLDDAKDLDKLYTDWIGAYRMFSVCFKGGQPTFSDNTFEYNIKLFRQYINKTDQIDPILNINSLTEHFLEYNLKDLYDGLRSCRYGIGISKQFLFTVYSSFYQEIESMYPDLLSIRKLGNLIEDLNDYEVAYCENNLNYLRKRIVETRRLTNPEEGHLFNKYNEIVASSIKGISVYLADLDILNSGLNLSLFDLVIIDDGHLSSSNKYNRLSECKQVIIFGDLQFNTSVANVLMRRIPSSTIFSYKRRYVQMTARFNNVWNFNNQYIYSYENKSYVRKAENFKEFILEIIKRYEANPTYVLNVLVASEHTRREIYTSIVEELAKIYDVDKVLYILTTNIRIIDVLTEGNNYVNDAFVYFDDFKELDPTVIELVFKNFISVKNNIGIYYLNNRLQSENASIEEQIKKVIGKPQMFEKQPEGITSMVINDLTENGLKIDLGYGLFDFVIRQKKPIAVIILGKYSDAINFIVDDYLYYYNEYIKRGFSVKVLYTLDLYHQYDKCLKELLNIAKVGTNNGRN